MNDLTLYFENQYFRWVRLGNSIKYMNKDNRATINVRQMRGKLYNNNGLKLNYLMSWLEIQANDEKLK